jgi:hypothetical protein
MSSTCEENRQFPRIANSAIVESTRLAYPLEAGTSEMGLSRNIGANGICLKTPTPYKEGDILSLKIDLPGWQQYKHSVAAIVDEEKAVAPLTAVVEVVWCKEAPGEEGYEMGVRFRDVYEDDRKALLRYLDSIGSR